MGRDATVRNTAPDVSERGLPVQHQPCPDTSGGSALRDLLWSLYNRHRVCQLWAAVTDLDLRERAEFVQLLLMPQERMEETIKAIFRETGELPKEGHTGGRIETWETRTMVRLKEEGRAES